MRKRKDPSPAFVKTAINNLLEGDFWIPGLAPATTYTRLQDDRDGETGRDHQLQIHIAQDADVHVFLPRSMESLRFRNYFGGGQSLRVRNALLILAEAIRRDNEERPQRQEADHA